MSETATVPATVPTANKPVKSPKPAGKRKPAKSKRPLIPVVQGTPLHSESGKTVLPWGMTHNNKPLTEERAKELLTAYGKRSAVRLKRDSAGKATAKEVVYKRWIKGERGIDVLWEAAGGDKVVTRTCIVWWDYFWKRGVDLPECATEEQRAVLVYNGIRYCANSRTEALPPGGREKEWLRTDAAAPQDTKALAKFKGQTRQRSIPEAKVKSKPAPSSMAG